MELKVYSKDNKEIGKKKLPSQFAEDVRADLIKRAVITVQLNSRQRYGADQEAGRRASAKLSRQRRAYRGGYGLGISRVPRKILSRNGTRFNWVGAIVASAVGGANPHSPKAEKIWAVKLNDKERKKAIRSALAAVVDSKIVGVRGHIVPANYPFVLGDDFDSITKTKEVMTSLISLGLADELDRSSIKKIRAGKGKVRGRKYKDKVGPLIVVSSDSKLLLSGKNVAGVDVVKVSNLNAALLAPGCHIGRLTLFTVKALDEMAEKKLFIQ
jgi:large subunit ribosomal protein L4e